MTRIRLTYYFDNNEWNYEPFDDDVQDALIDIIKEKFNIKEEDSIDAVAKICCQDEDLTYKLAMYYEEEITEYFKKKAHNDYKENYEPEEPDEWDEVDRYLDEKAVEYLYYGN